MDFLVDEFYAIERLNDPNVLFVDARGEDALKNGTLQNAIVVDWRDFAKVDIALGEEGWGHIMEPDKLAKQLERFGLDPHKELILFSGAQEAWGEDGRMLWQLRAVGYKNLKLVNGGIQSIARAGITLTHTPKPPAPTKVELSEIDETFIIDTEVLTKERSGYKLVDTRERDEYEGAVKFGEAFGGHIPSAINIPFSAMFEEDHRIKSSEKLERIFSEAGLHKQDAIVVYCTGGIRSAFMQLMMEYIGYLKVKSYQGSYYNWCRINEVER